jgi:hypothetical protein
VTTIEFDLNGIGYELRDRLLAVPLYQRSYAWDDDQLEDYCSDLQTAFTSVPREYFLGTIVLSKEGNAGRDTVIDGQQRLATTAILLAAMRDYYRAHDEDGRANDVHNRSLGSFDDESDEDVARLFLNTDDDEVFRSHIIDGSKTVIPTKDSHRLIVNAKKRLDAFVAEVAAGAGANWATVLVQWRRFLDEDVRVIHVVVPTESDAFMIFETLNDRGADLTLADLLKNYLFGKASPTKLDVVRENWIQAQAAFDGDVDMFITFLRHYWSSRQGAVRERDLYKSIKEGVTNTTQAVSFASDLVTAARLYAALLNSEHEYWNDWGTSAKGNIETFGILALEQNRPMLLAVLQHFTKAEAKKVLRAAVAWSVRGLIVGGIGGGATEKAYCGAAVKIRAGGVKTATELLTELDSIVATDKEFESRFETARVTKASLARYYLLALERGTAGTKEPELVPNANEEEVNLEHILPKNATPSDWPAFGPDERRAFAERLGNMALLKKSENTKIGNKPYAVKKPVLAASALSLTKAAGTPADWTSAEIESRQRDLANKAVAVWRRMS